MKPQHEIKRAEERLERIKDVIGCIALFAFIYGLYIFWGGLVQ